MALTPVPAISPALPPAPNPADEEAVFDAEAYAFTVALDEFGADVKAVGDATYANAQWAETKATEAEASAANAVDSAATAQSAATSANNSANTATTAAETVMAASNIDFGAFSISDGELISIYTDTAVSTPSIADGEFIITY